MQKRTVVAALAACSVLSAYATATTISEPTTLTEQQSDSKNWSPLTLNADLKIADGGKLYVPLNGSLYLPGEIGKDVTLSAGGTGAIEFYYAVVDNRSCIHIGKNGGCGHIVRAGTADSYCNYLTVWPSAEADDSGYIDYLCVSGGSFRASHYITNATPVRVSMAGGALYVAKSQTGVLRDLFNIGPQSKVVLASVDGATMNIGLNQGNWHPWMNFNAGEGKFETTGDGDLLFGWRDGGANTHVFFLMGPDRATWGHKGNTVINDDLTLVVGCDQALPHGPNTGVIAFRSSNHVMKKYIDLNGHTAQVNGLKYEEWDDEQCSYVTNSSETAEGVLQFGGLNDNSSLDYIRTLGNVVLEKIGTGTLTINRGKYTRLRVTTGKLVVSSDDKALSTIEIAAGATLEVRCELTVDKVVNRGGKLVFSNGGRIVNDDCVYEQTIDTSMMPSKWTRFDVMDYGYVPQGLTPTALDVVKKNTDTFTCFDSKATLGRVEVQEGRLRFGGAVDTSHYAFWRLTIRKTLGSFSRKSNKDETYSTMRAGLGRWWLTTADLAGADSTTASAGPSLLMFGGSAAAGTAPKDLAAGQMTSGKPSTSSAYAGGAVWSSADILSRPFYANSYEWFYSCVFSNDQPDPEVPSTWETIALRLSDPSTKTVGGYLLSLAANVDGGTCHLVSWMVEASADGITWEKLDDRTDFDPEGTKRGYWCNGGNLFLFNQKSAGWTFRPQGTVSVARGAVLDLDEIPDANVSIAKLEADVTAGAGTITKFAPAANGEIRLVNAAGELGRRIELHDVGSVIGADNLKSWSVYVNGEADKDLEACIRDGKLCVRKKSGLVLIFR